MNTLIWAIKNEIKEYSKPDKLRKFPPGITQLNLAALCLTVSIMLFTPIIVNREQYIQIFPLLFLPYSLYQFMIIILTEQVHPIILSYVSKKLILLIFIICCTIGAIFIPVHPVLTIVYFFYIHVYFSLTIHFIYFIRKTSRTIKENK